MLRETEAKAVPGLLMVVLLIVALLGCTFLIITGARDEAPALSVGGEVKGHQYLALLQAALRSKLSSPLAAA
jgi:hypothetical protein